MTEVWFLGCKTQGAFQEKVYFDCYARYHPGIKAARHAVSPSQSITIIIIIIITIIIVIALKGAFQDFFNLLKAPRTASDT